MCDGSYNLSLPEEEDFPALEELFPSEYQVRLPTVTSSNEICKQTDEINVPLHFVKAKESSFNLSQEVMNEEGKDLQAVIGRIK